MWTSAQGWRRIAVVTPIRLLADVLTAELRRACATEVVEETASLEELLLNMAGAPSDLLVLYDGSTSASIRELPRVLAARRTARVVVFGLGERAPDALACAELGIHGLVSRDASLEQLQAAIETVGHGGVFMSPAIRDVIIHAPGSPRPNGHTERLTPREREVATLVAAGFRNKQIARALKAGEGTVKVHVRHLMAKLQVNHRGDVQAALQRAACRTGLDVSSEL